VASFFFNRIRIERLWTVSGSLLTQENLDVVVHDAVTAHIDDRGTRWTLESWADMNTATIGRQASTRGLSDAVGAGRKVIVEVTGCGYCQEFAGEAMVGTDPLPPFHPNCTCMVSAPV
jgi:hypothetical protein